jgi:hypothetical protein
VLWKTLCDERAYQVAVLLGGHPEMTVAPCAQFAQLLDFGVRMLDVILNR